VIEDLLYAGLRRVIEIPLLLLEEEGLAEGLPLLPEGLLYVELLRSGDHPLLQHEEHLHIIVRLLGILQPIGLLPFLRAAKQEQEQEQEQEEDPLLRESVNAVEMKEKPEETQTVNI